MQAFAGDRPGLLPTRFQRALSTSISNEKRMNLLPPFECLNTRHWPVFNDKAGLTTHRSSEPGRSALRFDLGSERLGNYFPIPHHKGIGSEFVRIVGRFRSPNNIGVITVNRSVLHRK